MIRYKQTSEDWYLLELVSPSQLVQSIFSNHRFDKSMLPVVPICPAFIHHSKAHRKSGAVNPNGALLRLIVPGNDAKMGPIMVFTK